MAYNPDLACARCAKIFTPDRRTQIYCSPTCKKAAYLARKKVEWKAEGELEAEIRAAVSRS